MPTHTCNQCGATFKANRSVAKYCSRRCYGDSMVGENHHSWKGGGTLRANSEGYMRRVIYPDHPFYEMGRRHSGRSRDVMEHRLVMAEHLGRLLLPHETVHHVNGDVADNRIENLELRVGRHGKGATHAHCATCTCFER